MKRPTYTLIEDIPDVPFSPPPVEDFQRDELIRILGKELYDYLEQRVLTLTKK